MLKLMIADDERAIRESIYAAIDWESMGITVIGLAKNGSEAYEMMLDDLPDIVLTDICMPGLSGLEMIARIIGSMPQTVFIILSGYNEFRFAQEAMKLGVQYYLLKPCTASQLMEALYAAKTECLRRRALRDLRDQHSQMLALMQRNVLENTLMEIMNKPLDKIIERYTPFLDYDHTGYDLYYFQQVSPVNVKYLSKALKEYFQCYFSGVVPFFFRASNTFFLLFETFDLQYADLQQNIACLMRDNYIHWKDHHESFSSLRDLLSRLKSMIKNENIILINSKPSFLQNNEMYLKASDDNKSAIDEMIEYVREHISDPDLSLRWRAENKLYMNADYLSKQFIRQTGEKFSSFLTRTRMECAKNLLSSGNISHIYSVAEQVGLGNSPQYFSLLFKKATGYTPKNFLEMQKAD